MTICRVSTNKHNIALVHLDNHNTSRTSDIRSTLRACKHSPNYISVHNKLRIYVSSRVTVEIPRKHVNTVLWRGECSCMFVIMVADICYNGVKVNGEIRRYVRLIDRHVCRKCSTIWEWGGG